MFRGRGAVSEVGSRRRLPCSTRWNASSCIIETDGRDCNQHFVRLRIDHLDHLGYCSFSTRFASVWSDDAACFCLVSFQRFIRLLDFRLVMRFFLSFPPVVGYALFSPAVGCTLLLWLTCACTWSSTLNLEISFAAHSTKSRLKFSAFCFISLSMDTNRHSRPFPSCHVSRAVSHRLITSDAKPPESGMWTP